MPDSATPIETPSVPNAPVLYEVEPRIYTWAGIICGVVFAFGILVARNDASQWPMAAVPLLGYAVSVWWLMNYRIVFTSDRIIIATIQNRERTVLYRTIKAVGLARRNMFFGNRHTFAIDTLDGNEVKINTRLFAPGLRARLSALDPRKSAK